MASKRMRAAVLTGPGEIQIAHVDQPDPGSRQVRFRVEGCGVCASNLTPWAGHEWVHYPGDPGGLGHEAWGVVDAVGDGVEGLRRGDRIAAISYRGFAEFDTADADAVVKLPPQMEGQPFPGEAFGCAFNIARRSGFEAGQTVAIVGVGFLGAILTRIAADAGATVIAIGRRQSALDLAARMGAAVTIPLRKQSAVVESVREFTGGRMCERVIEAVGKQDPLDLASELVAERGRLIIAGYHQDGPRQVNMWLWNWRGIDVVNAHERDPAVYVGGMKRALAAVTAGNLDPSLLVTHEYPLEELAKALDATRDRPDGFMKAVVVP